MADGDIAAKQSFARAASELPKGLMPRQEAYKNTGALWVPAGYTTDTGEMGSQLEGPNRRYPNSFMPCLETIAVIKWTNVPASSVLRLDPADVTSLNIFNSGIGNTGLSNGAWWDLGIGDTTLQKDGAFVYAGHTFVAWGHSISYEGAYYRGAGGLSTDARVKDQLVQDGPGSYAELMLEAGSTQLGFQVQYQGDLAPKWMGTFLYNGDSSQLRGGALLSMSSATLPAGFRPWERDAHVGARDDFNKWTSTFALSTRIDIAYIAGNAPTGDIYQQFRFRIFGARVCGTKVPGC